MNNPKITVFLLSIIAVSAIGQETVAKDIIISDFHSCVPTEALSSKIEAKKWRLLSYKTKEFSGQMLTAASVIDAPPLTFNPKLKGWYQISVGVWNPPFSYDGNPLVKIKLSSDLAFRRIAVRKSSDTQKTTFLREVPFTEADMTGQNIVFGKSNGLLPKSAFIAYLRFRPMSETQIMAIKEKRKTRPRNLIACLDGMSHFWVSECTTQEQLHEVIAPYRHSDVGKVLWAVTYGSRMGYPTQVKGAEFIADASRMNFLKTVPGNSYVMGDNHYQKAMRSFAEKGIIPQQVIAEQAHSMGLKFDLMFRLGILGGFGLLENNNFCRDHPEFRQVQRDGTIVSKSSYAFPEVQQLVLDQIGEAVEKIDADGINLCFVRGPHFLQYEEPILKAFRDKYPGEDARKVPPTDPRLIQIRARIMTNFLKKVRGVLDKVGKTKKKKLTLSVWVWPWKRGVWLGGTPLQEGLDVKKWITEGLLDSICCQEGIDPDYIMLGKKHHCDFVLFTGYRGDLAMKPSTIRAAYQAGVGQFVYWDIDLVQIYPDAWHWIRDIGQQKQIDRWTTDGLPKSKFIQLLEINGTDSTKGLADSVYSGG